MGTRGFYAKEGVSGTPGPDGEGSGKVAGTARKAVEETGCGETAKKAAGAPKGSAHPVFAAPEQHQSERRAEPEEGIPQHQAQHQGGAAGQGVADGSEGAHGPDDEEDDSTDQVHETLRKPRPIRGS